MSTILIWRKEKKVVTRTKLQTAQERQCRVAAFFVAVVAFARVSPHTSIWKSMKSIQIGLLDR